MPASTRARSSSLPAGPTKGCPLRSSSLPGCSPTNINSALFPPSPNTVCVPRSQRSHAWQSFAAARTLSTVGRSGIRSAAECVGFFLAMRSRAAGLEVFESHRDVPSQSGRLRALHRAALQRRREFVVAARRQRSEIDAVPHRARLPRRVVGPRCDGVPRTDFLADIAAVDARPDPGAVLGRDVATVLDRQVRNALGRVEDAGRDERVGRAGVEAERARAALIERRRIDRERQAADDLGQENPRAELWMNDAGVLADPAEAGVLRVDPFLHRPGVDIGTGVERLGGLLAHPCDQPLEPFTDQVVVVVAPGVTRDLRARWVGALDRVRTVGVVDRRRDDHRLRVGNDVANVGALVGGAVQVAHLAGVAAIQPLAKKRQLGMRGGRRYSTPLETNRQRVTLDVCGSHWSSVVGAGGWGLATKPQDYQLAPGP